MNVREIFDEVETFKAENADLLTTGRECEELAAAAAPPDPIVITTAGSLPRVSYLRVITCDLCWRFDVVDLPGGSYRCPDHVDDPPIASELSSTWTTNQPVAWFRVATPEVSA